METLKRAINILTRHRPTESDLKKHHLLQNQATEILKNTPGDYTVIRVATSNNQEGSRDGYEVTAFVDVKGQLVQAKSVYDKLRIEPLDEVRLKKREQEGIAQFVTILHTSSDKSQVPTIQAPNGEIKIDDTKHIVDSYDIIPPFQQQPKA